MNILFLCTGNSCRSIIAEALFRAVAPSGFIVQSAGSKPTGVVHPGALNALVQAGVPTQNLYSTSWNDLPSPPDIVITLCDDAENEDCPAYFGKIIRAHWGMPDPARVEGNRALVEKAFVDTVNALRARVNLLARIPFEALAHDRAALVRAVEDIASKTPLPVGDA